MGTPLYQATFCFKSTRFLCTLFYIYAHSKTSFWRELIKIKVEGVLEKEAAWWRLFSPAVGAILPLASYDSWLIDWLIEELIWFFLCFFHNEKLQIIPFCISNFSYLLLHILAVTLAFRFGAALAFNHCYIPFRENVALVSAGCSHCLVQILWMFFRNGKVFRFSSPGGRLHRGLGRDFHEMPRPVPLRSSRIRLGQGCGTLPAASRTYRGKVREDIRQNHIPTESAGGIEGRHAGGAHHVDAPAGRPTGDGVSHELVDVGGPIHGRLESLIVGRLFLRESPENEGGAMVDAGIFVWRIWAGDRIVAITQWGWCRNVGASRRYMGVFMEMFYEVQRKGTNCLKAALSSVTWSIAIPVKVFEMVNEPLNHGFWFGYECHSDIIDTPLPPWRFGHWAK